MASKKKKREKIAKANERERLYYKAHPEEAAKRDEELANASTQSASKRRKDSRGKKIPTEEQRKRRANREAEKLEKVKRSASNGTIEQNADIVNATSDKLNVNSKISADKSASKKKRKYRSYETFGSSSSKKQPKKTSKSKTKDNGFFLSVITYACQNLMGTFIILAVAAALVASVIIGVHDGMSSDDGNSSIETEKSKSLVGVTTAGKTLMNGTGKFDDFFVDEASGIPYADLFDMTITEADAKALKDRGQSPTYEGTFTFNPDVSSAVKEGVSRAQSLNGDDAATIANNS